MSSAHFQQLGADIQDAMPRLFIPGVGFGLIENGEAHAAGFGVTSIENPQPVTPRTLFQVGSISKTFTGVLASILVEAGSLDLDVPVRTYLPELTLSDETVAARVTMRHLLNHTGGWVGDIFDDTGWGDDALARMVAALADVPQLAPLGELWSYNNAGFYIAGRVIEKITGQSFEAAMQERVLTPLGMTHTFYFPWDLMTHRFVVGHEVIREAATVARPWYIARNAGPVGSVVSCIEDMLIYARFHLSDGLTADGTRLLSVESMGALRGLTTATDEQDRYVGLTMYSSVRGGKHLYGHGGATGGQKAELLISNADQFAFILLTNGDYGTALNREMESKALTFVLGLPAPELSYRTLSEAEAQPILGSYEMASSVIQITREGERLIMLVVDRGGFPKKDSPPRGEQYPPMEFRFYDETHYKVMDGVMKGAGGEVLRGADGRVAWFRLFGRVHKPV